MVAALEGIRRGREVLSGLDAKVCQLHGGVLSPEACEGLIERFEALGYGACHGDYPTSYRTNDRLVLDDPALAATLFEQMRSLLPSEIQDPEGRCWRLVGLNERFRCCRYLPGQRFGIHRDGVHHRADGTRSWLTFMVYLNEPPEFEGGRTRFFQGRDPRDPLLASVTPQAGSLIVFDHDLWHDGEAVSWGRKYILRSDILYALASGEPSPTQHQGYVWSLLERRDGRIASGSRDRLIRMWIRNPDGLRCAEVLEGHTSSVTALAEDAQGRLWSGSRDGEIRRWQGTSCDLRIRPGGGAVLAMVSLPNGRLASGHADGVIRLWASDGGPAGELRDHRDWVRGLARLDGPSLASVSEDGTAVVWDLEDGAIRWIQSFPDPLWAITVIAPGTLALGDARGRIWRWCPGTPPSPWPSELPAHRGGVRALAALSGGRLASGGEDDRLCVWDLRSGHRLLEERHDDFVSCLCALEDGGLLSGSYDLNLRHDATDRPCRSPVVVD